MAVEEQGYDDSLFEGDVSENFKCPICLNVLRDPLQCQTNEHYFCSPCIKHYLTNIQQKCPNCREELTLETARKAPRIVTDCLLELKMRCEYVDRGCPEFVALGQFKTHTDKCGFAPIECDDCSAVINRSEKEKHETMECRSRVHVIMSEELEELKRSLAETKNQFQYGLNRLQGETKRELVQIKRSVAEMRTELEDSRRNQERVRLQVVDFMAEMRDEVKRLAARLPSLELALVTRTDAILISGGFRDGSGKPSNSVEMFHATKRHWRPINAMNKRRAEACSVLYRNQMIITGGWTSENATSTMEILSSIDQLSGPQWKNFPGEMPCKLFAHKCLAHENKMILTGGWSPEKKTGLGSIFEILLDPPYTATMVATMPEPKCLHAAQLIENRLFILGGTTTCNHKDSTDEVLVFNINSYAKPTEMPPLPFPFCSMATVVWKDKIILLGGMDSSGQALNTVLMYNTMTGESNFLPKMNHHRDNCSAVVLRDVVVVMGGIDENRQVLNSVEYYHFDRCSWEELAPMIEPRASATAVVMSVS